MENQLQVIVKESGLDSTKAKVMLENFQDYFEIAADWEKKAKVIVVTDESQTGDMAMARTGRLFLREKRIAIENKRKELKEQSLREGKAIDGIANVLKALIEPLEKYLYNQEHFVELKQQAEDARLLAEAKEKAEAERLAKEKAEREEQERIRFENIKLQKEAAEKDKQIQKEREEAESKQKAIEEKARKEREKERLATEKKHREEREEIARQEHEKAEKLRLENEAKLEAERKEREIIQKKLDSQVECPKCHFKFVPKEKVLA